MERNASKIEHIFDFTCISDASSRQLNNRGFSLIILKSEKSPPTTGEDSIIFFYPYIEIHPNAFATELTQNNDCKYRAQVLDHDLEYSLSVELAFPMKYFFLNLFDPNDSGYQQTGGNGRNRHHHGVGQEIEEIQKLHADDGDIG